MISSALKRLSLKMKLMVCVLITFQYANAQTVVADVSKAEISFVFTYKNVKGSISDIEGVFELNEKTPEASKISGTSKVKTLKTGNFIRNGHLMAKKYFYAKVYPEISFVASNVSQISDGYLAKGMLTIKTISREVSILFKKQDGYYSGKLTINTMDYDISVYKNRERNNVKVNFKFPISYNK